MFCQIQYKMSWNLNIKSMNTCYKEKEGSLLRLNASQTGAFISFFRLIKLFFPSVMVHWCERTPNEFV